MLITIAKMILVFILLVVLVIVISLVVWGVKEIIRWLRKERGRKK